VGESRMIRTQMGKHNRSVTVAAHGTPCDIPPRNSKLTVTVGLASVFLQLGPLVWKNVTAARTVPGHPDVRNRKRKFSCRYNGSLWLEV
jgi:hypothetical protein